MAKQTNKRLVLLDAHAIIHRAYHALPDFSSSQGEPTGALYGLSAMLIKIIQELNPDYIAGCFDLPEPTHRHEVFEEYKAKRKKTEDELVAQLIRARDVFDAFGIPSYEAPGFEADDLLGTIVEKLTKNNSIDIVIASGDMDTLQLVDNKKVQVFTLRKGIQDTVMYDEEAVRERFGFGPELLPDFKGIMGDPSDNIPGVPGVGETSARKLVAAYGDIDSIYAALKKDKDAVKKKTGIREQYIGLLLENEEEAHFSKMLATIRRDAPTSFALPKKVWRETIDIDKVLGLFAELEFRTLGDRVKKLLGVETTVQAAETVYAENIDERALKETEVALWLIRSDVTSPTLEDVLQFAGTKKFTEARQKIFEVLKQRELEEVFNTIENPLISVMERMNETGIALDVLYLGKLSKEYRKELQKFEKNIFKHAGTTFNVNSPKQLGEILFDKLGLQTGNHKKTATGRRSTRESELEKLGEEHPIVGEILKYRELQKLLSTYIDPLPSMVGKDGRLHAEFLQAGTTTGRLASKNPNLQNIPIKTALGRRVRNAFVAEEGYKLLALDYSQIELRIAAILSKDKKLISVFKEGGDIHTAVASEVFDVAPEDVNKKMRRRAKVINFGILYGMGVNALKQTLGEGTTQKEARAFYDKYFEEYGGLAEWIDHTKADAARLGYTETLFGRRRYFEGINSHLPHIRAASERMAINAPIQGTQADVMKLAMIRVDEYIQKNNLLDSVRLVLQIHDELVYEIRDEHVKKEAREIKKIMESILPLSKTHGVPLSVEVSVGKNWGEMKNFSV
jgi:DNA polymerase-1